MAIFRRPGVRAPGTPQPARRRLPRSSPLPPRTLLIVGAVVTVLTLFFLAAGSLRRAAPQGEVVFVTTVPIPAQAPIVPQAVRPQMVPKDRVPNDAVRSPQQLADKASREPIPAGEVLTEGMLIPVEEALGIASLLREGMQAFTVVLPEVDAAMGRVVVGNRVDVLATFQQPAPATRVVAREALVIGVQQVEVQLPPQQGGAGQRGGQEAARLLAVTLAVPADVVPQLVLGQHAGRLALAVYPAKGAAEASGSDGVSIPMLVQGLLPKEQRGEGGGQRGTSPTPVYAPPSPRLVPPPPPPQPVTLVPEKPTERPAEKPKEEAEPTKQAPPLPPQSTVEVIRGGQVRVEVVPVGDAPSTPEGAASRTRQEGSGPLPVPQAAPPQLPPVLPPQAPEGR